MSTDDSDDDIDADGGERRGSPQGSANDPLEERTQPMDVDGVLPSEDPRAAADTTTLGVPIPPPIVLDDDGSASPVDADSPSSPGTRTDAAGPASGSSLHPMLLERIEPSIGRGERLRLDATRSRVRLGRAEENDIRLYTASASREHATIAADGHGQWQLTPGPGKSVAIDGEETSEAVLLELGMNVVLGQDHLRCVSEGLASGEMAASTAADGLGNADASLVEALRRLAVRAGPVGWAIGIVSMAAVVWLLLAARGD